MLVSFNELKTLIMKKELLTKDLQRVQRSINSILAKIEISMMLQDKKRNRRLFESEKELEEYCEKHGLIYFPTKYPF